MFFVLRHLWIPINAADDIIPTPPHIMPVLGKSPCMYSGSFDPSGFYCPVLPMPVTSLPIECSSFIYDGLICNENFEFNPSDEDMNNMQYLSNSGKKLYIYYSHGSLQSWMQAITNTSKVPTEASKLASFIKSDIVAGLILKDLNYNYDGNLDYHVDPGFYDKLQNYVSVMKQTIPDLKIGLYVNASNMIYYSSNPYSPDWFDFNLLNEVMDFYVIGFDKFNPCSETLRGGIVPINNICGVNNSLTQLATALYSSRIAKDQIYVEFLTSPTPNDTPEKLPACAVTYQQICEASKYKNIWCADNSDSLYDKGKFAKQQLKAQGIIPKYIDTIDPTGACECEMNNQFITFKMMLRGFSEADPITDCLELNSIKAEDPSCPQDIPITATVPSPAPIYNYFGSFYNYLFN